MPAESVPRSSEVDRGPKVVEQVLDLSLVAVLWFMTRTSFSEGFFGFLGLLPELALTPPIEAYAAVALFVAVSAVALGLMWVAMVPAFGNGNAIRSFLSRALAATSLAAMVGLTFFTMMSGAPYRIATSWTAAGVALVYASWRPLYIVRQTDSAVPVGTSWIRTLRDGTVRLLGPRGATALAAVVLVASIGQILGSQTALHKKSWIEVKHPALSKMLVQDADSWVLMAESGGKIWVAPVRGSQVVGRLVGLDSAEATLGRKPDTHLRAMSHGE
jgi:hypothetical protein